MAVDYGLHAILTKDFSFDVVEEIGDAIRDGIPTIKTMMTYGYMSDDGQRWGVMSEVAEHGGMSVVHAEDDAIANWLTGKYIREGKTHGAYICEVRGPLVEEAAIRRAMFLAERAGLAAVRPPHGRRAAGSRRWPRGARRACRSTARR